MSRFTRPSEQECPTDGIAGALRRIDESSAIYTHVPVMDGIIAHLMDIMYRPSTHIRTILKQPHSVDPDITIGALVSTAIADMLANNGRINIVRVDSPGEPLLLAGIAYENDKESPASRRTIALLLNNESPEGNLWLRTFNTPGEEVILPALDALATAGYLLVNELSKNSAMVVRRSDTEKNRINN